MPTMIVQGSGNADDHTAPSGGEVARATIRFRLGDEIRELRGLDPCLTVLDWLRGEARRIGTKEGCNEGDCGACTVVIARPEGGRLVYRAVNSCIQFMGTLDGCQLFTVEDLRRKDGSLHAVQQAMVDAHGSQCGFCTPGFVMSIFAMAKTYPDCPSDDRIDDILAGNLCRCTGYAPIVRAVKRVYELGVADAFGAEDDAILAALAEFDDGRDVELSGPNGIFHAPATIDSLAATLLRHPDATIVSGSTDVGLWATKQFRRMARLVWIGSVRGLDLVEETRDTIEIGAGATYTQLADSLAAHYPDFGELLRRLGSVQVRNIGTMGGNVANGSPIGDSPPCLIALDATLHLRRGDERRSMPIERFFLAYGKQDRQPGEFVEKISLPKPGPGQQFRAYKVSKRFDQDISAVMGAYRLTIEDGMVRDARIAYGGMAATPKRAIAAEAAIVGRPWDEAAVVEAQEAIGRDFTPLDDMRASATYRMTVARNLLDRLLIETTEDTIETRLVGPRSLAHA